LPDEFFSRCLGEVGLGKEMSAISGPIVAPRERRNNVASRYRGIRRQGVTLNSGASRHHPKERLLNQVIDHVRIPNTGPHYLAYHRNKINDHLVIGTKFTLGVAHRPRSFPAPLSTTTQLQP